VAAAQAAQVAAAQAWVAAEGRREEWDPPEAAAPDWDPVPEPWEAVVRGAALEWELKVPVLRWAAGQARWAAEQEWEVERPARPWEVETWPAAARELASLGREWAARGRQALAERDHPVGAKKGAAADRRCAERISSL
jgi:hypothetical protein